MIQTIPASELAQDLDRLRSVLGALVDLFWQDSLYEQSDAEARYNSTLMALTTLIKAESLRQPFIMFVEDVQFIDEDSLNFLPRLRRAILASLYGVETARQMLEISFRRRRAFDLGLYQCGEGEGMAEHSFEWSGSLQPVDQDPDGIFPAAGFDAGFGEPAPFTNKHGSDLGYGRPGPWVDVYLRLVYDDDATGELVRKPVLSLVRGPSVAGKITFGPVPEEEEYEVEVAVTPEPRSDYETWRPRGNLDPSILATS